MSCEHFFSHSPYRFYSIDESCSLIPPPVAWNFHISRGLFLARRPEETHRCSQLVCILIDARFTEPNLYIAAMSTDELFVPRSFVRARPSIPRAFYAGCVGDACTPRAFCTHSSLITGRVIRLRCNPSVASASCLRN